MPPSALVTEPRPFHVEVALPIWIAPELKMSVLLALIAFPEVIEPELFRVPIPVMLSGSAVLVDVKLPVLLNATVPTAVVTPLTVPLLTRLCPLLKFTLLFVD